MSRKGWALFALVGLLWGVPYLFMKVAVDELATPVIVFSRLLIGAIVLVPLALYEGTLRPAFKYWKYIALYAIAEMVIPWSLITNAQKELSSGVVALLVATVPIWATLFAHHTGDSTAAHRTRIFGIAIGLIGILFLVGFETLNDVGNIRALIQVLVASASYAYAIAMALSTVIFAPFAFTHLPSQKPSNDAVLATIGLGVICTALAFWVFFIVLKEIGAARASLVVYPNTAVAVMLGIFLLDEQLTLAIVIGLPMVLLGSYFASRKPSTPVIAG
jgi:drug/metabolite transporter (DMT)-like permease